MVHADAQVPTTARAVQIKTMALLAQAEVPFRDSPLDYRVEILVKCPLSLLQPSLMP